MAAVSIILLYGTGCSTADSYDSSEFAKVRIRCRVLNALEFEVIPFAAGPLFRSFVFIQILEPAQHRADKVKLILWSGPMNKYKGPDGGSIWRDIDSVLTVTTLRNKYTGGVYLSPHVEQADFIKPEIYCGAQSSPPNKLPEPTPGSVTPAADAAGAPVPVAAHR